jgi:ABC transporter
MKKRASILAVAVLSLGLGLLAGCGNSEANLSQKTKESTTAAESNSAEKGETEEKSDSSEKTASGDLLVSTFGLNQDIVEKDIIKPFEEEYGVKVTLEVGNAAERLTKVESGGSNVDVIELSQAGSTKGYAEGLFEELTEKEVPNIAKLSDKAKQVYQNGGGIPFSINSIGIIYDKEKVGHEIKDWKDLWESDLKNSIAIPDITTTAGPLFLSVAEEKGGKTFEEDKGEAAFKALEELKPNIVKTYSKSSDLANMFQAGEIKVAVVADFGVSTVQKADEAAEYIVPLSGTYANFNTVNVVKGAKNKENAFLFINHRISTENQAAKAKSLAEAPVNKEVQLSEEEVKTMTYGDVAERAKIVDFKLVNENLKDWIDQWNKLLNQ